MKSETGTEVATPKAGTANIQGKVFFNLMPVEGIEVMLCVDAANLYGDCIGKKLVTKTDANGQYLFADLEPRVYNALWVRVFKTQNYVHAAKYGFLSLKIKAEADKTFFVPLTSLFKTDLKVLQPKAKTNSLGEKFEIAWEAYPDAASYSLELMQFGGSVYHLKGERTKDTSYKFDKTLPDGHYRLRIEALNSSGIKLAQAGEGIEFFIKSSQ